MFRSDWYEKTAVLALSATLALVLIFAAGLAGYDKGNLQNETQNHARNYTERSDDDIKRICSGFDTSAETIECTIQEKTAYRDAKRAEEDLGAQKEMARWAWYILIVTGAVGTLTVIATGLGVYWVKKTLDVTALNVSLARDSVRAAESANTNTVLLSMRTDEYARRQIRAYVVVNDSKINEKFAEGISVRFDLVNTGQTPSYETKVRKIMCFWPSGFADKQPPSDADMFEMDPVIVAPGGGITTTVSKLADNEIITKVKNGELVCIVFGLVTYLDVFDNTLRRELGDKLKESERKEWFLRFSMRVENFGTPDVRVVPFGNSNIAN